MSLRKLIFLFTFVVWAEGFSQFRLNDYLSSVITESEIEIFDQQKLLLTGRKVNSPFIQDVDIRLRTNDLDASPEDFRFRLDIINPAEISANKSFREQYGKTLEARRNRVLNELLRSRYQKITEYQYYTSLLDRERSTLIYLQLLSTTDYGKAEISDLLKIDQDLLDTELRIKKILSSIHQIELEIRSDFSFEGSLELEESSFISIAQMTRVLSLDSSYVSPYVTEAENEITLTEKEFDYDVSRAKSSIGFVQPEMDIDRGNEISEHLGFQLGFKVPIVNNNQARQQYEKIEILEDNSRLDQLKEENQLTIAQYEAEFKSLLESLDLINERAKRFETIEDSPVSKLSDDLGRIKYQRRLQFLALEYEFKLREVYLDLLKEKGKLSQLPRVNYLSGLLEEF